jgi:hypothetical protein
MLDFDVISYQMHLVMHMFDEQAPIHHNKQKPKLLLWFGNYFGFELYPTVAWV